MGTNLTCASSYSANDVAAAAASALADFKNPYESTSAAVEQAATTGTVVGKTYVSDDGTTVSIKTKVKDSTETKFTLTNTVVIE